MRSPSINFRTLDLNLLRVFDVVMVERHVTRAAARLSMTQPAVSNALRRLREATHEELFLAGSNGVTPTAHAQALWPTVRTALERLQAVLAPQAFDPLTDQRTFTLAMADATAALFVPVFVQALQAEQARTDMRVIPLTSRDPRPLLDHGQADIALGFFPGVRDSLAAEGADSLLRLELLYTCEYVAVMRKDHPLAAPGALTLEAYCQADHLRVSFAGLPRGFVDEALTRLGRERRVMLTVSNYATAGSVVHRSDLLTVLPRSFVPATGFAAELAQRPLPLAMPGIEVALLWHLRHENDSAQRWLRDQVRRAAAQVAAATQGVRATARAPGLDPNTH